MVTRLIGSLAMLAALLGGCATYDPTVPSASPPTGYPGSVVRYPHGHYELRGHGTPGSPYYWQWVPRAGAIAPAPEAPLLPRR